MAPELTVAAVAVIGPKPATDRSMLVLEYATAVIVVAAAALLSILY